MYLQHYFQITIIILLSGILYLLFLLAKKQLLIFSYSNRFVENQLDQYYRTISKYLRTEEVEITDEELKIINSNEELRYAVNMVMNYFEDLSCAYNMGLLDRKYAYIAFSEPIFYAYRRYRKRIDYVRVVSGDTSLMNQLEKAYIKMKKKKQKELKRKGNRPRPPGSGDLEFDQEKSAT